jgi:hypothetical protein
MQSGQLFKCATLLGGTELFKRLPEVFPRVALGYEVHLAILVVSVDALVAALLFLYAIFIWLDSSSLTAGAAGSAEPARMGRYARRSFHARLQWRLLGAAVDRMDAEFGRWHVNDGVGLRVSCCGGPDELGASYFPLTAPSWSRQ